MVVEPENELEQHTLQEYFRALSFLQDEEIAQTIRIANERIAEARKALDGYLVNCAANRMSEFEDYIAELAKRPAISTGFSKLDDLLGGGFYEGLYVIGAISSLGKTAFTLQIADKIAENDHSVLIFSLEMSRFELMARSISRLTAISDTTSNTVMAKSTRGILDGHRYAGYSTAEKNLIQNAKLQYQALADKKIFIWESEDDISLAAIHNNIEAHIKHTGQRPVVIIDYLQILPPPTALGYGTLSEKQAVDRNVTMLKRISREFNLPLIIISSFNRGSYKRSAMMEAFKESGGIEYSADVLIALQYKDATDDDKLAAAKQKNPREIELVVLKNRNGQASGQVNFDYYPAFNLFVEAR